MLTSILLGASALGAGLALRWMGSILRAPSIADTSRKLALDEARPFAKASPGESVVVSGAAEAGPEGPIVAPVSGTRAAWVRVETTEERSTDPSEAFVQVGVARRGQAFEVVEGESRVLVRVGEHDVEGLTPKKTGPVVRPSAALADFLDSSGAVGQPADDFVRRREYAESALPAGGRIFVLGIKRGGRPEATGYRDTSEPPWVEATLAHAALDAEDIQRRAKPEPPGVTTALGWCFAVGGPVLAGVLIATGQQPDVAQALLGPPAAALGLWVSIGLVKLMLL